MSWRLSRRRMLTGMAATTVATALVGTGCLPQVTPQRPTVPFGGAVFPAVPGERARMARLEVAAAFPPGPNGRRAATLLDVRGRPGVLRSIWFAWLARRSPAALEDRGRITIWLDDESAPAVEMPVNDFFLYATQGGQFSTPRVGRTLRSPYRSDDYAGSAYRYCFMPWRSFCRVEYSHDDEEQVAIWAQAGYTELSEPWAGAPASFRASAVSAASHQMQTPIDLARIEGPGTLESIWVAPRATVQNAGDWIEGNIDVYLDGEATPSFASSGGEDFFNGGFGVVPVGGWPAGRCGDSLIVGATTWYRFFLDDPISFQRGARVVWNVGQRGQPPRERNGQIAVSGGVTWWSGTSQPARFVQPGDAILLEDFARRPAGVLGSPWQQQAGGAQWSVDNGVLRMTDVRAIDRWVRFPVDPDDYWVEGRVRITEATAGAEAFVFGRSAPGGGVGDRVSVQITRGDRYDWVARGRDGFDTTGATKIDAGNDLLNQWVDLALLCRGLQITAYWKLAADERWQPFVRWTTRRSNGEPGLGSWLAAAEVQSFAIRRLSSMGGSLP